MGKKGAHHRPTRHFGLSLIGWCSSVGFVRFVIKEGDFIGFGQDLLILVERLKILSKLDKATDIWPKYWCGCQRNLQMVEELAQKRVEEKVFGWVRFVEFQALSPITQIDFIRSTTFKIAANSSLHQLDNGKLVSLRQA